MKTALVLSGGGAKGAFQVGALSYLREQGFTFDVVAGVSVGSLNGSMVAQDKWKEMNQVWATITEKQVHKKPSWLTIAWNNLIKGKMSLYDLSPLGKILDQNVKIEDFKVPYYCGICSLKSRKYSTKGLEHFANSENLRSGIFASSLMPILWEPIHIKTKDGEIRYAVDGGVKNVIPVEEMVEHDVDRMIVITCNNTDAEIEETDPENIIDVFKIVFLEMMLDEIVYNDMKGIEDKNDVIRQATEQGAVIRHKSGRELRHFDLIKIEPPVKIGSSTDFSRSSIDANLKLGYETAKQVIEALRK